MYDVIIIGRGPAGVSASLYAARAGLSCLIIGKDSGALGKAEWVENFYGHPAPVSGAELVEAGVAQAKRIGAEVITAEVFSIALEDDVFIIETTDGVFNAKAAVLATGAARTKPEIENAADFEGRGVSYCAVCDAFFHRGKPVAVLGNARYALHEVNELLPVVGEHVSVLTNGRQPEVDFPENVRVITEPVASLSGGQKLEEIRFKNGETLSVSGLFIALGTAGSTELAKKIGAAVDGGNITVGADTQTTVPGLFAAGDCTGGMKQIAKAVYEGALAGTGVIKFIRTAQG